MKILLISIEFVDPIFSGNGVACRSLVRSLLTIEGLSVFVVCGCPMPEDKDTGINLLSADEIVRTLQISNEYLARISGISIPLPKWYRTDIQCSYTEFCKGACSSIEITEFGADLCLAIDWSGSMAHRCLRENRNLNISCVYFPFCCYSYLSGNSEEDRAFYNEQEFLSMESSLLTFPICSGDEKKLRAINSGANFKILLPPLRIDIQRLTLRHRNRMGRRRFITCCLRLHPSKNVEVFVDAIGLILDLLRRKEYVPVLCGAAADLAYAKACRSKLRTTFPESVIFEEFLNAEQMLEIFHETKLNIHTALYEAYGMTIIEAAAGGK